MGGLSLLAPFVVPRVLRPVTPGRGRFARGLVGVAVAAAVVTTAADVAARRAERRQDGAAGPPLDLDPPRGPARRIAAVGGVAAIDRRRSGRDHRLGRAPPHPSACGVAGWSPRSAPGRRRWPPRVVGWDFIYYWNHRFMHTSRYMWAVHEVHHSSERYNLSTALRQPVADALGHHPPLRAPLPVRRATRGRGHRAGRQPHLPVLDPHRGDRPDRAGGAGAQLAVPPPRPPRVEPPVPRPQPRWHPDRVGPDVRDVRARGRAGGLRAHHQHRHLRPGPDRRPRVRRHGPRRRVGVRLGRAARPTSSAGPAGRSATGPGRPDHDTTGHSRPARRGSAVCRRHLPRECHDRRGRRGIGHRHRDGGGGGRRRCAADDPGR